MVSVEEAVPQPQCAAGHGIGGSTDIMALEGEYVSTMQNLVGPVRERASSPGSSCSGRTTGRQSSHSQPRRHSNRGYRRISAASLAQLGPPRGSDMGRCRNIIGESDTSGEVDGFSSSHGETESDMMSELSITDSQHAAFFAPRQQRHYLDRGGISRCTEPWNIMRGSFARYSFQRSSYDCTPTSEHLEADDFDEEQPRLSRRRSSGRCSGRGSSRIMSRRCSAGSVRGTSGRPDSANEGSFQQVGSDSGMESCRPSKRCISNGELLLDEVSACSPEPMRSPEENRMRLLLQAAKQNIGDRLPCGAGRDVAAMQVRSKGHSPSAAEADEAGKARSNTWADLPLVSEEGVGYRKKRGLAQMQKFKTEPAPSISMDSEDAWQLPEAGMHGIAKAEEQVLCNLFEEPLEKIPEVTSRATSRRPSLTSCTGDRRSSFGSDKLLDSRQPSKQPLLRTGGDRTPGSDASRSRRNSCESLSQQTITEGSETRRASQDSESLQPPDPCSAEAPGQEPAPVPPLPSSSGSADGEQPGILKSAEGPAPREVRISKYTSNPLPVAPLRMSPHAFSSEPVRGNIYPKLPPQPRPSYARRIVSGALAKGSPAELAKLEEPLAERVSVQCSTRFSKGSQDSRLTNASYNSRSSEVAGWSPRDLRKESSAGSDSSHRGGTSAGEGHPVTDSLMFADELIANIRRSSVHSNCSVGSAGTGHGGGHGHLNRSSRARLPDEAAPPKALGMPPTRVLPPLRIPTPPTTPKSADKATQGGARTCPARRIATPTEPKIEAE